MIAKRLRPGTTSRKSSSRLPARSADSIDRPVMLPPGRARLATRPAPTGSPDSARTIGIDRCRLFCLGGRGSRRDDDINLKPDKLGGDFGIALAVSLRPAILDLDGATLDPAKFAHPPDKSGGPLAHDRRCSCAQEPDGWQLSRLLRARRRR